MIKVGILGGAGYTAGELLRLLVNHKEAEVVFVHSESSAGKLITEVHEGLYGDTLLRFTAEKPFDKVDLLFFCFGHGKSKEFISSNNIPSRVKIIDLAQDFRLSAEGNDFVYGLPEINSKEISKATHIANPGCFATCIQLALLPAAKMQILKGDVVVNALTGSSGAGQKPAPTTHFSWRNGNISIYKPFVHQHLPEIIQSLKQVDSGFDAEIDFIPYRGDFSRGIFSSCLIKTKAEIDTIIDAYKDFYKNAKFTHYVDFPLDLKQVVNTNKCLIHCQKYGDKLLVTSAIDNLLKGAAGQAVENMNLMFGLEEQEGLSLKASAF